MPEKKPRKRRISITTIVIIILAIVGAFFILSLLALPILYSLLIFNPGAYSATITTGFTSLGPPGDWGLQSDGSFSIIINNALPNPIEISMVEITKGSATDSYEPEAPIVLSPGGTYMLHASESGLNLGPQLPGETYSVAVSISYNAGGLDRTEEGMVSGIVS